MMNEVTATTLHKTLKVLLLRESNFGRKPETQQRHSYHVVEHRATIELFSVYCQKTPQKQLNKKHTKDDNTLSKGYYSRMVVFRIYLTKNGFLCKCHDKHRHFAIAKSSNTICPKGVCFSFESSNAPGLAACLACVKTVLMT